MSDTSVDPPDDQRPEKDGEEAHFKRVLNSFKDYENYHQNRLKTTIRFYDRMPVHQRQRLSSYRSHLDQMSRCIKFNAQLMLDMIKDAECMFENKKPADGIGAETGDRNDWSHSRKPRPMDMEKTACVMRQIVREWTRVGAQEREQSFGLILDAMDRYFGSLDDAAKRQIQVLVPGAGLGRLACDIAKRGFATQGNEYSMFMLIASHFIINKCRGTDLLSFYPFVHQVNNVLNSSHQIQEVTFPDEDPSDVPHDVQFSMTAGSFIDVYSVPEYADHFDAVTTCFFMDTAHNILQYMETLKHALRPNGLWINLGPLLYHFADMAAEDSVEPSYDFVRDIILSYGFEIVEERHPVPCFYTQNPDSMLSYVYKCVFFVARKTSLPATDHD